MAKVQFGEGHEDELGGTLPGGHTELGRVARVEMSRETNSDHMETCQLGLEESNKSV